MVDMPHRRYDNVTFMMCLPRSRSAWLAHILKPVAWTAHDPLKQCASIDDLGAIVDHALSIAPERPVFIADTAAVLFFDDIGKRFPDAKYLFVRRPAGEVLVSAGAKGVNVPHHILRAYERAFDHALGVCRARRDLYLRFHYGEIDMRLRNIWRFVGDATLLTGAYAEKMKATNIQVPFDEQRRLTDARKVRRLFDTIGIQL